MSDVFFGDLHRRSHNGRYRLEVQSPMNGLIADRTGAFVTPPARAMQGDFRYTLIDDSTSRTVWERWQERNEGSPAECVVCDNGWVVVRTHSFSPQMFIFTPAGEVAVRVNIRSTRKYRGIVISADDETWIDDRVIATSAGAYWAGNSWRYFFRHDDKPYFAWRPYWGRRLVFSLDGERGQRLSDEQANEPGLLATMIREEGDWASRRVTEAALHSVPLQVFLAETYQNRCKPQPIREHLAFLIPAIQLCGVHQRHECISSLLELESLSFIRSTSTCRAIGMDKGWSLETELFRPVVHHALRRMGQVPRGLPPFRFPSRDGQCLPGLDTGDDRRTIPERVRPGITPIETLERIGSPDDYFEGAGKAGELYWDYDFHQEGAWFSHRLTWARFEDGNRLAAIETVPAPWLTNSDREFKYLWS